MTKYGSKKTVVDGYVFASMKEAARYQELVLLKAGGKISSLRLQPKYELQPSFRNNKGVVIRSITYIGDFEYMEDDKRVVEDVKGYATKDYRLKKKMFEYKYPSIEFREVR